MQKYMACHFCWKVGYNLMTCLRVVVAEAWKQASPQNRAGLLEEQDNEKLMQDDRLQKPCADTRGSESLQKKIPKFKPWPLKKNGRKLSGFKDHPALYSSICRTSSKLQVWSAAREISANWQEINSLCLCKRWDKKESLCSVLVFLSWH